MPLFGSRKPSPPSVGGIEAIVNAGEATLYDTEGLPIKVQVGDVDRWLTKGFSRGWIAP